ncbi:Uncharacterised protein [Bordetella pertussis]|nr:Uncharacterised protein [Bordetella pertussis]
MHARRGYRRAPRQPLQCRTGEHHAPAYSWYLRHFHGWPGADRALGRPQGHRLRRRRLPPDEHPAGRAGHRADRRLRRRPAGAGPRPVRDRQRGQPRQPADGSHPGQRRPLYIRPAMAGRAHPARRARAGRGRHPRQDHYQLHAGLDPAMRATPAQLPDRRRRARPAGVGALRAWRPPLRDRGRRVRHGLFRQALEVRALPAAHRHPEQPGIRSRRHLPRSGRHRDPVPSPGAHGAAQRPAGAADRRAGARTGARARLLDPGCAFRPRRPMAGRPRR